MTFKHPGLKFLLFSALCVLAAAYVVSVTGNYHRIPFITQTNSYTAVLGDVSGLFPGDDVRLSGVKVGRVDSIGVERGNAVVTFRIEPDIKVLDSWEVGVRWRNIIGSRQLYLYPVEGGKPIESGGRIPLEQSRRVADIGRFFNELTPLLEAIDAEAQNNLLTELNKALVGRADEVSELTSDVGHLGNTLADREVQIARALRNGNRFLGEYNAREEELTAIIDDLHSVGGVLRARNDEVLAAITDIAEVQEEFGALLAANDEELNDIVDNLDVVTTSIGENREDFDRTLATLPDGLAVYNVISRWGQWFNVRGVGVQITKRNGEILFCRVEQNGPCSFPNDTPEHLENKRKYRSPTRPGGDAGGAGAAASTGSAQTSLAPTRQPAVALLANAALGRDRVSLATPEAVR